MHLAQLLELPYVQKAMQEGKEITANLDQNPLLFDHHGRHVPVVLASTSHMWGALRARPMTWKDVTVTGGDVSPRSQVDYVFLVGGNMEIK